MSRLKFRLVMEMIADIKEVKYALVHNCFWLYLPQCLVDVAYYYYYLGLSKSSVGAILFSYKTIRKIFFFIER